MVLEGYYGGAGPDRMAQNTPPLMQPSFKIRCLRCSYGSLVFAPAARGNIQLVVVWH